MQPPNPTQFADEAQDARSRLDTPPRDRNDAPATWWPKAARPLLPLLAKSETDEAASCRQAGEAVTVRDPLTAMRGTDRAVDLSSLIIVNM